MKFPSSSSGFPGQGGSGQKEVQDTAYTLRNRYIVFPSNDGKGGSRKHWPIQSVLLEKQTKQKKKANKLNKKKSPSLLFESRKTKRWDCSSGPQWSNCPWDLIFHRREREAERGKPKISILFSFSPRFQVTAVPGAEDRNQTNRAYLDRFFLSFSFCFYPSLGSLACIFA